ncbi:MAG: hypothetical protein AAGK78_07870 [Planctomycetota bacterium]
MRVLAGKDATFVAGDADFGAAVAEARAGAGGFDVDDGDGQVAKFVEQGDDGVSLRVVRKMATGVRAERDGDPIKTSRSGCEFATSASR